MQLIKEQTNKTIEKLESQWSSFIVENVHVFLKKKKIK